VPGLSADDLSGVQVRIACQALRGISLTVPAAVTLRHKPRVRVRVEVGEAACLGGGEGMRSRPVSSYTNAGGAYVLGEANRCPQVSGPPFSEGGLADGGPGGAGGGGKERVREHGQGDVPVPGPVLADLVAVQPGLALCLGEAVLDSPSRAGHRDDLGQGDGAARPGAEEHRFQLSFLSRDQGTAYEQVMTGALGGPDERPVV
jgi:hypothetical protein